MTENELVSKARDWVHNSTDPNYLNAFDVIEAVKYGYELATKEAGAAFTQPSLKSRLDALTDDQRVEVFGNYCKHCGRKDPRCQCWNDE